MSEHAPSWPRAPRPLSICIIGWAKLSAQQSEGSGYNLSASELACGLALSGHRVSYLRSGMDYTMFGGPRIEHVETWRGVECHSLLNSPNLAISRYNFRNQSREMNSPDQTRLVMQWLNERQAEVVHVHSLEGFSLDVLPAVKASGRTLIVTLHNHWYVCPQVDLLQRESGVCMDYRGGRACETCIPAPEPKTEIRRRRVQQFAWDTLGPNSAKFAREIQSTLAAARHGFRNGRPDTPDHRDPAALACDRLTATPLTAPGGLEIPPGLPVVPQPRDANETFLNQPHHLTVLNQYGERRLAGLRSLAHADRVIGPSRHITDALVSMGFPAAKCAFIPYGQPHFDALRRIARGHAYFDRRPWNPATATRPLRLGFLGTTYPNKGLEVLTRAIPLLRQSVRQSCHFVIRAHGDDAPFRNRLGGYPEVTFQGGFRYEELASIHRDFDVAIVPHIWLENAPLVMLELLSSGRFIIMSRLGGVVDFIREAGDAHLGNGVFFSGGDHADLAAIITRVVNGDVVVPSPREVCENSPNLISYREHVNRVEAVYASHMTA